MPAVSVLLPIRDAGRWLDPSIASLARQTLRDFEIVAVDDGSIDGSGERVERLAEREPRLRVLHEPASGLPAALATALAAARSPLIARHDADDVSHRERLERQSAFLAAHPRVDVVGTRLRLFPASATGAGMRRWAAWHNALLTHDAMRREALIDSPLAHGTAMLRRGPLEDAGGWTERGLPEDLDLWLRMFERGARFAKLSRVLYGWRQHRASATRTDPRYAIGRFVELKLGALDRTLLAGGRRATLVGVGDSLARWRDALGARVRDAVATARPTTPALARLAPPIVLVFLAASARERWRSALAEIGYSEMTDFVFVA